MNKPLVHADSHLPALLDTAAALFCRDGYHGTSVRDICRALGLSPGALYAHFPSKEALLLAVYREGVERIGRHVQAGVAEAAQGDPWVRLGAACEAHLEMLLARSDYAQVVIRVAPDEAPAAIRADLIALRDGYEQQFADLIEQLPLAAGSDRRLLRLLLLGALNGAQRWYRPGQLAPAEIARRFVTVLREGA